MNKSNLIGFINKNAFYTLFSFCFIQDIFVESFKVTQTKHTYLTVPCKYHTVV